MFPHRIPESCHALLALALASAASWSFALPEDDAAEIQFGESKSIDLALDSGEIVQKAYPDRPTCVTQGSRVICGAEIRLERANGTLRKLTATGTPATFQQQPAADQEVVQFSGRTLIFDNEARLLTIDGDAKFSQGLNRGESQHIEYDLETRVISAEGGESGEGAQVILTPSPANGN